MTGKDYREEHVVYEMLSLYVVTILEEMDKISYKSPSIKEGENEMDYEIRLNNWIYSRFDSFANCLNDIFAQFCLNVYLTRQGLIFKQDNYITEQIFEPVLRLLSSPKWEAVNRELSDSFADFRSHNDGAYSSSITHAISALEAFLQILNEKAVGSINLTNLIDLSYKNKKIPYDSFTRNIFKNIESILMQMRKNMGDAHPKKEYATHGNAKLFINLVIIFMQHCLEHK